MRFTFEPDKDDSCCLWVCGDKRHIGLICNQHGSYQCVSNGAMIGYKDSLAEAKKAFIRWYKMQDEIWSK